MSTGQVRTTVYLDEDLYIAAKKKAIEERTTLTSIIQKGVKEQIKKGKSKKASYNKDEYERLVEKLAGGIPAKMSLTPDELNEILDKRYELPKKMLPR